MVTAQSAPVPNLPCISITGVGIVQNVGATAGQFDCKNSPSAPKASSTSSPLAFVCDTFRAPFHVLNSQSLSSFPATVVLLLTSVSKSVTSLAV